MPSITESHTTMTKPKKNKTNSRPHKQKGGGEKYVTDTERGCFGIYCLVSCHGYKQEIYIGRVGHVDMIGRSVVF